MQLGSSDLYIYVRHSSGSSISSVKVSGHLRRRHRLKGFSSENCSILFGGVLSLSFRLSCLHVCIKLLTGPLTLKLTYVCHFFRRCLLSEA